MKSKGQIWKVKHSISVSLTSPNQIAQIWIVFRWFHKLSPPSSIGQTNRWPCPQLHHWNKPMTLPTITPLEQTDDPAQNYTIGTNRWPRPQLHHWNKPMTPPTITPLEQTDDPAQNYTIGTNRWPRPQLHHWNKPMTPPTITPLVKPVLLCFVVGMQNSR